MIKYFCDKCGHELDHYENNWLITVDPPEIRKWGDNAEAEIYNLCYECARKAL